MKHNNRFLATLTALCLLGTLVPASAMATEGQMPGHLDDCSYSCNHQHTEDCGFAATAEGHDCADVHVHHAACGYIAGQDEVNCTNENCVGTEDGHVEHRDAVPPGDCTYVHEHDEGCGYVESVEGTPCSHKCTEDERSCAAGCPMADGDNIAADESISTSAESLEFDKSAETKDLELDMADGSVAVSSVDGSLMVVQGDIQYVLTGGVLILTGNGGQNTVKLADGVELMLVTDGVTLAAAAASPAVSIGTGASIDWELQNVNSITAYNANAIQLNADANVRIYGDGTLDASNKMGGTAAIRVPQGAELDIDGIVLDVKGSGAAIGSDWTSQTTPLPPVEGEKYELTAGTIQIVNGAQVTAKGGTGAAAIGGGQYANGGTTLIGAGCTVYATAGGNGAAAIGGGTQAKYVYQTYGGEVRGGGKAGDITIESGATVFATSGSGAAIGRAVTSDKRLIDDVSGSITIKAGARVTAISLGHDNYTDEHGKPYYFAIDAGINNTISASILNARFDKEALPKLRGEVVWVDGEPYSKPAYNNILVTGNNESVALALPAGSPSSAFAVTVPGAGDYMVANAAEGKETERAEYLLEGEDNQFLFTVGDTMTTRDQLKFASFTITASAGEHGSISGAGETVVSPLDSQIYTFTPDEGYVVDEILVDGENLPAGGSYIFTEVTGNHTIAVTFKTAPVTPDVPSVTRYTVTVNYLNAADGAELTGSTTLRRSEGSSYDVSEQAAKAIGGYTIDRVEGETSGTLKSDVTVNVYYVKEAEINDPETPAGPNPPGVEPESPEDVTIDDGDVPTAALPELPAGPETPGETVIVEGEVPLGDLPQTGTAAAQANPAATLGLAALALSMALAGVTAVINRKREDAE